MSGHDAAIAAMNTLLRPIIGITLVLMSVFLPAAFMPGLTGRMYAQFALVIAATALLSVHHVWLQDHILQHYPLCVKLVENRSQDSLGYQVRSKECSPSMSSSGSTTGTSPASWHNEA